ncbi:MAG: hypothetical protein DI536_09270 [Archangium gephyra]|uniref:TIGR03067 domain-containing protein n=1 Tax=Archangium gephyra TaxID=48 RepID=A0A2W5THG6_9BACT|nr:MAG: hypothetical protein DI536_09270 [Archangium gephyra]
MHALALLTALAVAAPTDGSAAFDRLKKLEGSWKTDAKDGPVQYVMLRLVGGNAVLETTTGPDRTTVTSATVYSLEGADLVATNHGAGGASRLKVKDADPVAVRFDGSAKDARVAGISLVTKDNKLLLEHTVREGGKEVKKSLTLLREYVDTLK